MSALARPSPPVSSPWWRPNGYGARWAWASLVVLPLFLLGIHLSIGARPEHFVFVAAFLALAWAGPSARRMSGLSAPIVVTGIAYDLLRLFKDWRGQVHVADLYRAEHALFGPMGDVVARHTHLVLDILCGLVYITYLPEAIMLSALLFFRDKRAMATLTWTFALISLVGWTIWMVWPAAPPWYVDTYGLGPAVVGAKGSAAGAARFDTALGVHVFRGFYERSWNVFGAMPSLHVGYAVVAAAAVWPLGGWWRRTTVAYAVVMAFGSVYLRHHYILDGVCGLGLAIACNRTVVHVLRAIERRTSAALADPRLDSDRPSSSPASPQLDPVSPSLAHPSGEVTANVPHGLAHR
jgi:membrane-associated phospholipid phosphatase